MQPLLRCHDAWLPKIQEHMCLRQWKPLRGLEDVRRWRRMEAALCRPFSILDILRILREKAVQSLFLTRVLLASFTFPNEILAPAVLLYPATGRVCMLALCPAAVDISARRGGH